jgi:hypothetical protein
METDYLRRGNLVMKDGKIFKVDGITSQQILTDEIGAVWEDKELFSHIELSEEILLRFGFEKGYENAQKIWTYDELFKIYDESNNGHAYFYLNYYATDTQFDTVHELQNIFNDIFQTEIELDSPPE